MSSGKFHISNDGNVRSCRAKSEASCTAQGLGGRHFDSAEEGRAAVEKILGTSSPSMPTATSRKTRKQKLDENFKKAAQEFDDIDTLHKRKLKEFSKVEAEIKKITFSGGVSSDQSISDYSRLKVEIEILAQERAKKNKALIEARRARDSETARTSPTPPPRSYGYGGGGCGGGC